VKQETVSEPPKPSADQPAPDTAANDHHPGNGSEYVKQEGGGSWDRDADMGGSGWNNSGNGNNNGGGSNNQPYDSIEHDDNYGPINVKEDG
jgi:hypothetical protein